MGFVLAGNVAFTTGLLLIIQSGATATRSMWMGALGGFLIGIGYGFAYLKIGVKD